MLSTDNNFRFRLNSIASSFSSRRDSIDSQATFCDGRSRASFHEHVPHAFPPPSYETVVATPQGHAADADASLSYKLRKFPSYVWQRRASVAGYVSLSKNRQQQLQQKAIDAKAVDDALKLMNIALVMQNTQPRMSSDLYMMAITKLISEMPVEGDTQLQTVLEQRLDNIKKQNGQLDPPKEETKTTTMSDRIINAAVTGAIALKRSPIPDAVASAVNYAKTSFQAVDETYHVRQKTLVMAAKGIDKALEIDRQFNVHQKLADGVCTGAAAFIKASIAYAEATQHQPGDNRRRSN